MLGRRKDRGEGEVATGLVLDNQTTNNVIEASDTRRISPKMTQHLTLRVTYADGTTTDVQTVVKDYGLPFLVGEQVPVRISAGDRTSVEVDVDGLKATHQAEAAAGQEWNRDLGELDRKRAAGEISDEAWEAEAERMLFEDD